MPPAGWTTRRETGPAERGGAGAYCDLIIDPDGDIREIVEYDRDGRELMRVYGMPKADAAPVDPRAAPAPPRGDVPAPGA